MTTDIEQRITRLEDIEAIKQLKATYCYLADAGMKDAAIMNQFADYFADDIWVDFEFLGTYRGKEAVVAFYRDQVASLLSYSAHMVSNPRIRVAGDQGTGEWYVLVPLTVRETGAAAWLQARYTEQYVRLNNAWKWQSITARFEHITPYETGWGKLRIMDEFMPASA